ncbi:MAG: FAD-dependent oxidoreductase [Gammaproteobacteria bacterium]
MHRDLKRMASVDHDVVVVGGGIHGACAAWEAARRGLRVALVEADDFGNATTSNSLRTFHGGLRYLQQLDFKRMRESIRERREWLRIARDIVKPVRFVLPTSGYGMRGPAALGVALFANDMVSIDRNDGVWADRHMPRGELWRARRARQIFAGTAIEGINGAAVWYDAICLNTERLQIAILAATVAAGAQIANYARALEIRRDTLGASGVRVRDEASGREYTLRGRAIINAAGPWVDEWLPPSRTTPGPRHFAASKAFNLLTRPLPFVEAIALPCSSTYFAIPWNGRTLIGTRHLRCQHSSTTANVTADEVHAFLGDINSALGKHRIAPSDVLGVFCGLLPEREGNTGKDVALLKTARVIDHGAKDGLPGLYSIVGIKWTTARAVAERAVGMACAWMSVSANPRADRPLKIEVRGIDAPAILDLIAREAGLGERVVPDIPVAKAQIVHAARSEMALCLWDVVRRRVPLYLSDMLDTRVLETCAELMARVLGWSRTEIALQVAHTLTQLDDFRGAKLRTPAARAVQPDDPTIAHEMRFEAP